MKRIRKIKAKGILEDPFKSRPITAREKGILNKAGVINRRRSNAGRISKALSDIRSYVVVSNHPIPTKIENLKVDLAKTKNPQIKKALERAIAELENW